MKKSRILTLQRLKDIPACKPHIRFFKRTLGDKVRVTENLAVKYWDKFNWNWAALYLLSEAAEKQYLKAAVQAFEQFQETTTPSLEQFQEATALEWKQFQKSLARSWARLYINDGGSGGYWKWF